MDLTLSRKKEIDAVPEKLLKGQLVAQTLLRDQKIQEIERLKREVERADSVILYIQQKLDNSTTS